LLKEFCTDRPHIYFLAAQEAETRQREKFIDQIAASFDERPPRIDGWDEAFEYLGEKLRSEAVVVVIDEFPYLVAENDSVPSYLQGFVDEQLQETDSMLILCGSSVSTMESEILGHESPLSLPDAVQEALQFEEPAPEEVGQQYGEDPINF
jgi:AAA+ ATPase superfamily predicted ATPase